MVAVTLSDSAPRATDQTIDLRLLIISSDGTEADLPAIRQTLDYLGVPYVLHIATAQPGMLTQSFLGEGSHGHYQGVILATDSLAYHDGAAYVSALGAEEWQCLHAYLDAFRLRQVSWYTYPAADYGYQPPAGAVCPTDQPLHATLTPAGRQVFGHYLRCDVLMPIQHAYTYLARALDDGATVPLLLDPQGHALAAVHRYPSGREHLSLTFDSNPNLLHTLALAYGLVSWVTGGLFLGEQRIYLGAYPADEAAAAAAEGGGGNYRAMASTPQAPGGGQPVQHPPVWGSTVGGSPEVVVCADASVIATAPAMERAASTREDMRGMQPLDGFGTAGAADGQAPPRCSGPAGEQGLGDPWRYIHRESGSEATRQVAEAHRPDVPHAAPRAGFIDPQRPGILMVPRRPTNLYYNVSTPAEWLAEDHCLYPEGCHGHAASYEALLGRESEALVRYLLRGDGDPLMFHEANLRGYAAGRTLLTDLLGATLARYRALLTLPVESPPLAELGRRMAERMAYDAAGASGRLRRAAGGGGATVELRARGAAVVPVTGLAHPDAACYGGQPVAHVLLGSEESATFALQPRTMS